MLLLIERIFPFVSIAIFSLGIACKLRQWLTVPLPLPITIFPAPSNPLDRLTIFLKEALLFKSIFHQNRPLWLMSWAMHLSLGLIIIGHVAGIYFLGEQFMVLGVSQGESLTLSHSIGMSAGIIFLISLFGLMGRRLYDTEAGATSVLSNYFEIGLLIGIALTGTFLRMSITEPSLILIREYIASLVHGRPIAIPNLPLFFWHFILLNILVVYLPYSKLRHGLGGIIIRIMLTEPPPEYPTSAGKPLRSTFAAPVNDGSLQPFQARARR